MEIVTKAVLEEFVKLREKLVPEKELIKAKEHLTGNLVLSLETSDQRALFLGMQEIEEGKIENLEEIIKKVKAVRAEEVRSVAENIFKDEGLNMALIGPFNGRKTEAKLRNILSLTKV